MTMTQFKPFNLSFMSQTLSKCFLVIVMTGCIFMQGMGQGNYSLKDCIDLAQKKSPEAAIARKGYEGVYWDTEAFQAGLKPQAALSLNTPGLFRSIIPVTLDDGTQSFLSQNRAFSSANLVISQAIAPTGGTVSLSSGLNRNDIFGSNGFTQYNSVPFIIRLSQPLFGFNSLKWQKKSQPLEFRRAEKSYLEALEDIASDICGKYFDVYIAQLQLANSSRNEQINDSIYTISQGRFRVGKIAENDLLQTELAALNARAATRNAALALNKAKNDLTLSLGLPDETVMDLVPPEELEKVAIDVDFAMAQANQNRSEVIGFTLRQMRADQNLAQAKAGARVNASIDASFGLNQTGSNLEGAYVNPLDQQAASLGVQIPIFQWGRGKAQVESAMVGRDQIQEQIQLDQRVLSRNVKFQVLDFLQLQDQFELTKKTMDIAERRFEVTKNRYLIGKVDITNLQIAQGESITAQASYFQTLKQYWQSYFQLRRSTLYDFVQDLPLVAPTIDTN